MKRKLEVAAAALALGMMLSCPALADTFTTQSSFLAALTGGSTTANFDADAAGTVILTGNGTGTADGITFQATVAGGDHELIITNVFETTSSFNYLGTTDQTTGGALFGSDSITMNFSSPVNGVGLFILGGNSFEAGTFQLCAGANCALNSATQDQILPFGTFAYYLGLTSTTSFSSATLSLVSPTGPGDGPPWNVDDITSGTTGSSTPPTVPEPGTLVLLMTGGFGLLRKIRK